MNVVCGGPPGGTGGTPSPRAFFLKLLVVFFAEDLRAVFLDEDFFAELFFAAVFLRVAGRFAVLRFDPDFFAPLFLRAGARFADFFFAGAFPRAAFFPDFRPFFAAIGRLRN